MPARQRQAERRDQHLQVAQPRVERARGHLRRRPVDQPEQRPHPGDRLGELGGQLQRPPGEGGPLGVQLGLAEHEVPRADRRRARPAAAPGPGELERLGDSGSASAVRSSCTSAQARCASTRERWSCRRTGPQRPLGEVEQVGVDVGGSHALHDDGRRREQVGVAQLVGQVRDPAAVGERGGDVTRAVVHLGQLEVERGQHRVPGRAGADPQRAVQQRCGGGPVQARHGSVGGAPRPPHCRPPLLR